MKKFSSKSQQIDEKEAKIIITLIGYKFSGKIVDKAKIDHFYVERKKKAQEKGSFKKLIPDFELEIKKYLKPY